MKFLIYTTALAAIAIAAPAFAINDTVANGSVVVGGANQGVINNNSGLGAGGTVNTGSTNTNVNTALGGSAKSSADSASFSSSSAKQSQNQGQIQSSTSSVKGSGNSENSNTAVVNQNYKRNPVSTAYSAPLVAADDTCMGSSSAGGQGVGFGLSIGSTWTDSDCVRRKDARELHNMGLKPAAIALLCQSEQVRKAMSDAGTPCVGAVAAPAAGDGEIIRSSIKPESLGRKN